MNQLYQQFGGNQMNMFGGMQNVLQRWNQFKSTFSGDPKQKVQELLNSGKMTQQQYNQFQSMANQLQSFLK